MPDPTTPATAHAPAAPAKPSSAPGSAKGAATTLSTKAPAAKVNPAAKTRQQKKDATTTNVTHTAIRGQRGNKADVIAAIQAMANIPEPDKTYIIAKATALNAAAIQVDFHLQGILEDQAINAHFKKLF